MSTPLLDTTSVGGTCIEIRITGPNGFLQVCELPPGDALVVGASPACGVRIQGPGIAAMHCTISSENEQLVIDDWDTGGGTYVAGQRIARQATVDPGATLEIGEFRLATSAVEPAGESVLDDDADDDVDYTLESDRETAESTTDVPPDEPSPAEPALTADPVDEPDPWTAPEPSRKPFSDGPEVSRRTELSDIYDDCAYDVSEVDAVDDTAELLRIELDYLRTELADRDARVAELEQSTEGHGASPDEDLPSREEVESLAGRLEELLEELDHSDERLKTMSEMLRVSEEANAASEEERAQMESWIGEVERRVSNWESEWHAERDSLNKRIAELTAQRDEAEARGGSGENTELVHKLRQQISQLEADTARLQTERDEMQHRVETADLQSIEERIAEEVNQAMREERLQLSQEKAECARERAELMRQQENLTVRQATEGTAADVADLKIRAFRQHLKEIRETEPRTKAVPTVSQRLGKLWRKIDGRPLDTD